MKTLKKFSVIDKPEDITAALQQDGAVIVEGLLDKNVLAAVTADMRPHLDAADPKIKHLNPALDAFFGDCVRHVTGFAGKSTAFAEEVMCHPLLLSICDAVLLPSCASYQLNLGHVMDRGLGAEQQWLHRDEDVWVHCPSPRPELQVATMVALVDFTEENGATCVIPGSHKWAKDKEAAEEDKVYAEMSAGSAVIYLGSTIHGGGTNKVDQWRTGLHLSYTLGWLRTEENNSLAVGPEAAKSLSLTAQKLLGYGVHDAIDDAGGYLGMVDMQDPIKLLKDNRL